MAAQQVASAELREALPRDLPCNAYDGRLVRLYVGNRGVTGLPNRRGGVLDAFVDTSISIRSGRSYVTKVGS